MNLNNKAKIRGKVEWVVYDENGNVKRYPQNKLQKLLGIPGRLMKGVNHNIVTDEGDAMIADLLATSPARTKADNTNGYIAVGTGWTGTSPKTNTALNTQTGSAEVMDSTYPKVVGSFGAANDNQVQYKSTFEAGDLNATSPAIDEVGLANASSSASWDLLAYAQITPEIPVASSDTLAVTWTLTILGA